MRVVSKIHRDSHTILNRVIYLFSGLWRGRKKGEKRGERETETETETETFKEEGEKWGDAEAASSLGEDGNRRPRLQAVREWEWLVS